MPQCRTSKQFLTVAYYSGVLLGYMTLHRLPCESYASAILQLAEASPDIILYISSSRVNSRACCCANIDVKQSFSHI